MWDEETMQMINGMLGQEPPSHILVALRSAKKMVDRVDSMYKLTPIQAACVIIAADLKAGVTSVVEPKEEVEEDPNAGPHSDTEDTTGKKTRRPKLVGAED